jgi:hypothetical protein
LPTILADDEQTSPYRIREGLPTTHYVTAKQVFNAISKPYSPTPEMVWAKDCDCRNQLGFQHYCTLSMMPMFS